MDTTANKRCKTQIQLELKKRRIELKKKEQELKKAAKEAAKRAKESAKKNKPSKRNSSSASSMVKTICQYSKKELQIEIARIHGRIKQAIEIIDGDKCPLEKFDIEHRDNVAVGYLKNALNAKDNQACSDWSGNDSDSSDDDTEAIKKFEEQYKKAGSGNKKEEDELMDASSALKQYENLSDDE